MSSLTDRRKEGRVAKRRGTDVLERDREIVTRMFLEGRNATQIAEYFKEKENREVSEYSILNDWQAVRKQWARQRSEDVAVYMAEELQAINRMLATAWDRYEEASNALIGRGYDEEKVANQDETLEYPAVDARLPTARQMTTSEVLRSREQAFKEQSFWWEQIASLHLQRQKIMGIGRSGLTMFINNNNLNVAPVKGYVGVSPDDWPEPGTALPATVDTVEGIYEADE